MLEGPLVFVDIDTQRDFLEPSGALYVPGSEGILPNLERLTRFAQSHRVPIVATACAIRPMMPNSPSFPPHCMAGTAGSGVFMRPLRRLVVLEAAERLDGRSPGAPDAQ